MRVPGAERRHLRRAVATGALDLGAIDAELPDVPAAASAMGALLHELSMPNFLL